MIKYFSPFDFDGGDVVLLNSFGMEKVAASDTSSEAKEFIKNLKPNDEVFYCLVVALGAGEFWGANRNGDYFPEEELIKSYKTFEDGHVFRQHQNKDPRNAIGRVLRAFWNDRMKRVELVIEVDRVKGRDILEKLERGEPVDVSMGCKVKYDICSVCGNVAKSRLEYCDHLKYHMGEVLPDGRQVFAINPNPQFFDISFVRKGADASAKVLMKVAQEHKRAEIDKEVPAQQVVLSKNLQRAAVHLLENAPDFPDDLLNELRYHPLEDVALSLGAIGIPLKWRELARLIAGTPLDDFTPWELIQLLQRGRIVRDIIRMIPMGWIRRRSFFFKRPIVVAIYTPMPGWPIYAGYQLGTITKLAGLKEIALGAAGLATLIKVLNTLLMNIFGGTKADPRWYVQDVGGSFNRPDERLGEVDLSMLAQRNLLGEALLASGAPERAETVIKQFL